MTGPSVDRAPRTEAGRALLYALGRRSWSREAFRQSILAIEAEAAQAGPSLDVLVLARAMRGIGAPPSDMRYWIEEAERVAAEYARLSEPK